MYAIRTYLQFGRDLEGISVLCLPAVLLKPSIHARNWKRSSGKTGLAIARLCFAWRGVTLVYAAIDGEVPYYLKEAIQPKL
jgi:hypothetical protein